MVPRERLHEYSWLGADSSFKEYCWFGGSTCLVRTLIKFERGPVNTEIKQAGDERLEMWRGTENNSPPRELAALLILQPKQSF